MTKQMFTKIGLAIVLLAFIARIPLLSGSFWLDEAAQALESARPLSQQFDIIADFQPPLLHLIVHFSLYFSTHEAWLRMWGALIPGLLTIAGTIYLGKKIFSEKVGLLAGLLLSISSFHVYFSQELRPYSLPALFAVLSWICLDKLTVKTKKAAISTYLLYGIFTWLGLFSSYLYPFLFLGQIAFVLWSKRVSLKAYVVTVGVTALAYVPWLPIFLKQLAEGQQVRQLLPGWAEVVSIPQIKALPITIGKFVYGVLPIDPTPFILISSLLLACSGSVLLFHLLQKKHVWRSKELQVLISWFLVPLITAWIISFIVPVVRPKRLLIIQPAFYLGLSYLFFWAQTQKTKLLPKIAGVFLGVLIFISGVSLLRYYTNPQLQRENWRALHSELQAKYPQKSIAVFSFVEPFAPWRWYDDGSYPTYSTGVLSISQIENSSEETKLVTEYDYLLVFDYLRTLTDPNDVLLTTLRDFGYTEVEFIDYPNIGFVRVFAKKGATITQLQGT